MSRPSHRPAGDEPARTRPTSRPLLCHGCCVRLPMCPIRMTQAMRTTEASPIGTLYEMLGGDGYSRGLTAGVPRPERRDRRARDGDA